MPKRNNLAVALVELLVVFAVVTVLAVIIAHAQENAPGRAKRIKCVNNLKQVGLAFRM